MKTPLILLLTLACASLTSSARSISVTRFGAIPDDGKNDAKALRKAAKYCREHKNTTLIFPAGTYQLDDPEALEIERKAIDGTFGRG